MTIKLNDKYKLKSTGQRFQISEIVTMYKLSPVAAQALQTPLMTKNELNKNFESYIQEGE